MTQSDIKNSIYQEEIFIEKRHRVILKDVFFFEDLMTPHIIYLAQSEQPINGEYRHGWAIYSVSDKKAVNPYTLHARSIFRKLPAVSKLLDVEAPDPHMDDIDYQACMENINELIAEMQKYRTLSPESVEKYAEYLRTMKAYRPQALQGVYDFFLENLPEADFAREMGIYKEAVVS